MHGSELPALQNKIKRYIHRRPLVDDTITRLDNVASFIPLPSRLSSETIFRHEFLRFYNMSAKMLQEFTLLPVEIFTISYAFADTITNKRTDMYFQQKQSNLGGTFDNEQEKRQDDIKRYARERSAKYANLLQVPSETFLDWFMQANDLGHLLGVQMTQDQTISPDYVMQVVENFIKIRPSLSTDQEKTMRAGTLSEEINLLYQKKSRRSQAE